MPFCNTGESVGKVWEHLLSFEDRLTSSHVQNYWIYLRVLVRPHVAGHGQPVYVVDDHGHAYRGKIHATQWRIDGLSEWFKCHPSVHAGVDIVLEVHKPRVLALYPKGMVLNEDASRAIARLGVEAGGGAAISDEHHYSVIGRYFEQTFPWPDVRVLENVERVDVAASVPTWKDGEIEELQLHAVEVKPEGVRDAIGQAVYLMRWCDYAYVASLDHCINEEDAGVLKALGIGLLAIKPGGGVSCRVQPKRARVETLTDLPHDKATYTKMLYSLVGLRGT